MSNIKPKLNMELLQVINATTFYAVNWCFLLIMINAVYKIRKMKDRLDIRMEMTWAVGLWSLFDFM